MKYIEFFEKNINNFEKYLDKFCVIYFSKDLFIVHVTEVNNCDMKFEYFSYDEKYEKVKFKGSEELSFKSFNPIEVCDQYRMAEKEYLILFNAKKFNI